MAGIVGKNFGCLPTDLLGLQLSRFRTLTLNAMISYEIRERDPDSLTVAEKIELRRAHSGMSQYMRKYDDARKNIRD
jgi:hypothetical protein